MGMRVPIFEGDVEICHSSAGNSCNDYVKGFSLLQSSFNLECDQYDAEILEDCSVLLSNEEETLEYQPGLCYNDSPCQLSFSNGFGFTDSSLSCKRVPESSTSSESTEQSTNSND